MRAEGGYCQCECIHPTGKIKRGCIPFLDPPHLHLYTPPPPLHPPYTAKESVKIKIKRFARTFTNSWTLLSGLGR